MCSHPTVQIKAVLIALSQDSDRDVIFYSQKALAVLKKKKKKKKQGAAAADPLPATATVATASPAAAAAVKAAPVEKTAAPDPK